MPHRHHHQLYNYALQTATTRRLMTVTNVVVVVCLFARLQTLLQFNVLTCAVQNTTTTQKQSDNVKQRLKHEIIIISTLIELKSYYYT